MTIGINVLLRYGIKKKNEYFYVCVYFGPRLVTIRSYVCNIYILYTSDMYILREE